MTTKKITRRSFLRKSTRLGRAAIGTAAFPYFVPSSALGKRGTDAPSNRITMGFIGLGGQGTHSNMKNCIRYGAEALALCDVDSNRLKKAQELKKEWSGKADCDCYSDWREIIARDDIDAVAISTPDHWHAVMAVTAAKAGKDILCEKPTLTIHDGRIMSDTVKRYGTVFQTAVEDRSMLVYHRMAELVRNARIGKLHTIIAGVAGGPNTPYYPKYKPAPDWIDWDMWLGPAPWRPYCDFGNRDQWDGPHWDWRWVSDYSGGQLTDWGAHILDTAQWASDTEHTGPIEVKGKGEFAGGLYDTARKYHIEYLYANGLKLIANSDPGASIRFEGSEGWIQSRGFGKPLQASSEKILSSVIGPEEIHLYTDPRGEQHNFLDCVKSRLTPYFSVEAGHRCSTISHLGNISMILGRKLKWDPAKERFVNDAQANRMLSRPMRSPWKL